MPFNPEISLESQFAIDPIDPASFTIHQTGAEVNEAIPMFSSGLDFLCKHELMRPMGDANHGLNDKQIWEALKSHPVTAGRPLSNLPSMFIRSDVRTICQVNIHELNIQITIQKGNKEYEL
jgi:hypothetical protein